MADNTGIARRAEIDALTVKALLTLNGGGVVALLAFVPAIMDAPMYQGLLKTAFVGIVCFAFGLASAVTHNICLRKCSLHYERHNMSPPKGRVLGVPLREPGICAASTFFKWASLAIFIGGSLLVSVTGILS